MNKARNQKSLLQFPAPLRLAWRALALVSPAAAEQRAARMFFTPGRASRRWTAPHSPRLLATAFRVRTEEHEIAAWSWGRGPAVLLVHGWAGQAAQLAQFVDPLVSAGFRAVTFDMPGHGASTGRELSVIEMAQAIRAVAQVVGPTHAVIAHSLGGTAVVWALRNGLETERVVFFAPPAEPTPFALALAAAIGLPPSRTAGMLRRIEERVGKRLADLNVARVVTRMTAGLLVIHDPDDPEVPFKHGESIARAWPGARIEPVSGMAHRRMLRDPHLIQRAIAFIGSRGASGAGTAAISSARD